MMGILVGFASASTMHRTCGGSLGFIQQQRGVEMERYGDDRDTGVTAYEVGGDFIRLRFRDGKQYLYDDVHPGPQHIAQMKVLAKSGRGLTTYVNQYVRGDYRRREL
jgi:hypothetical protein